MRLRVLISTIGSIASSAALAQFGASGGTSPEELLVKLPWLVVLAILALAWFGPRVLRPISRRVSKWAFIAYFSITFTLFFAILGFSAIFDPMTNPPVMAVGMLFLVCYFFSGAVIVGLMIATLCLIGAKAALAHYRERASHKEVSGEEAPPDASIERTLPGGPDSDSPVKR